MPYVFAVSFSQRFPAETGDGERNSPWVYCRKSRKSCNNGKAKAFQEWVLKAIDESHPAKEILIEGLLSGMSVVGGRLQNNEIFVPEVLVAARAMHLGTADLAVPYCTV